MGPEVNDYGDLVLTDAAWLRAMAQPGRLELFEELSRHGPLAVAALADRLGADPATTLDALRELAGYGVVIETGQAWRTGGKGIYFEIPDEAGGAGAGRALSNVSVGRHAE